MDVAVSPEMPPIERDPHTRITGAERRAIQDAYLAEPGVSKVALAKRFKMDRETVSRCLTGNDFQELKKAAFDQRKAEALDILRDHMPTASRKWLEALPKAVKKGDHKPMQDLLKATGAIADTDSPRIVVQVGVKLTGHPED